MEIYDDEEDPDFLPDINYGVYEDEEDLVPMEDLNNFRVNPEPEQLQFVMSKKGRDMVEYDGYLYTFRYNRGNGDVVYSCKHHRGGCMAKVVLNNNTYKMETITEHSHEADPVDVGKLQVYQEALRISMANRKISPRDVYNQAIENLILDDSVIAAVDYENIRHLIAKARKDAKNYPPGARNFQDVEIPEGWKYFADQTPFVFHDDPPGVASKAKTIRVRDPLLQNKRSKTSNPAIILALVDATENFNSENVPASLTSVTRATRAIQVDRRSGEADRRIPRYP
uniref:FLYWCH-type domain-containing protein n=1 Tax=Ditylenchus dipsaci TaxID=166011 RepID=A0A915ELR5_9BILA